MSTESDMPARIWATDEGQPYGIWGVSHDEGDTLFIRADIAEQMAEALRECAAVCAGETMNKLGLIGALEKSRAALSAWEASNPARQASTEGARK